MLAVAGNETTRNAIAHGMLAFLDHPGQWDLFKAERPAPRPTRSSAGPPPITVFQRTATQDTTQLRRGGLHRPRAVRHPPRPNPHLGYGGYGTHYCLGVNLAKPEIELIFNAIADAMPDIAKAGDPVRWPC
jgi:cholest-4-en-3-one 26-monooxygenase